MRELHNPTAKWVEILFEQQAELKLKLLEKSIQIEIHPVVLHVFINEIEPAFYYYLEKYEVSLFLIEIDKEFQLRVILGGKPNSCGKSTRQLFERIGLFNPYEYQNHNDYLMDSNIISYPKILSRLLLILESLGVDLTMYRKILVEELRSKRNTGA